MKRLRKECGRGIKYYACGEYGGQTHRPHYHAIIFNLPHLWTSMNEPISQVWQRGNVMVAPGNKLTFKYVCKYIMKKPFTRVPKYLIDENGQYVLDDRESEFSLMSKKLGDNFITDDMYWHLISNNRDYVMINGVPHSLPRYYKEKLFSQDERIEFKNRSDLYRQEVEKNRDTRLYGELKKALIEKHQKTIRDERIKI